MHQHKIKTSACSAENTYSKVVESEVGHALPGDVFANLLEHRRILLHTDNTPRYQLPMRPHRHMPRLYPHEVVEGELQY